MASQISSSRARTRLTVLVAVVLLFGFGAACSSDTIGYRESAVELPASDSAADTTSLSLSDDGLPPDDLAYVDDAEDASAADFEDGDLQDGDLQDGDFEDEPYVWTGFLADGETIVSESGRILVTCGSQGVDVEVDGTELVNVVVESDGLTQFFGGLSGSVFSTPGEIDTIWVRVVDEGPGENPDGPGYGERFDC